MKKLLLLALIVLSCLAFASCDAVQQLVPGLDLGDITGGENKDETIDNGGNTTEDNEHLPISEDEWIAAMSVTNYSYEHTSYNAYHGPFDENGQAITVIEKLAYTDAAKSIDTSEYKDCVEWYIIPIDGKSIELYLSEEGGEYVAYDSDLEYTAETLFESGMSLSGERDLTEHYKNLKYVGNDTYKAEYTLPDGSKFSYEVVIKNGKVEQLIASSASTDGNFNDDRRFYDIDSTVVNVPEYTFDEDENETDEAKIPITREEWINIINSVNYHVLEDKHDSNGIRYQNNQISYTATAIQFHSASVTVEDGREIHKPLNSEYRVIIDGVAYHITQEGYEYVGVSEGETEKFEQTLCETYKDALDISWEELYDYVDYDRESGTYKAESTYYGYEATFEVSIMNESDVFIFIEYVTSDGSVGICISSFGTTNVYYIPEFTIVE